MGFFDKNNSQETKWSGKLDNYTRFQIHDNEVILFGEEHGPRHEKTRDPFKTVLKPLFKNPKDVILFSETNQLTKNIDKKGFNQLLLHLSKAVKAKIVHADNRTNKKQRYMIAYLILMDEIEDLYTDKYQTVPNRVYSGFIIKAWTCFFKHVKTTLCYKEYKQLLKTDLSQMKKLYGKSLKKNQILAKYLKNRMSKVQHSLNLLSVFKKQYLKNYPTHNVDKQYLIEMCRKMYISNKSFDASDELFNILSGHVLASYDASLVYNVWDAIETNKQKTIIVVGGADHIEFLTDFLNEINQEKVPSINLNCSRNSVC